MGDGMGSTSPMLTASPSSAVKVSWLAAAAAAFSRRFIFFFAAFDMGSDTRSSGTTGPIISPFSIARLVAGPGAQLLHLGIEIVCAIRSKDE